MLGCGYIVRPRSGHCADWRLAGPLAVIDGQPESLVRSLVRWPIRFVGLLDGDRFAGLFPLWHWDGAWRAVISRVGFMHGCVPSAERLDEFVLAHFRTAMNVTLTGFLHQLISGEVGE